jgi:peptide/nickel transport system permease protein
MLNYIIRRLVIAFFLLIGVGIVSFVVIQLPPGDFASNYKYYLINQAGMSEAEADRAAQIVRERYDLDKPLPTQFFLWIKGMVTEGKFGYSFSYRTDVGVLIADRLPKTLLLALLAHGISTIVGVGLGIFRRAAQVWLLGQPDFCDGFCFHIRAALLTGVNHLVYAGVYL